MCLGKTEAGASYPKPVTHRNTRPFPLHSTQFSLFSSSNEYLSTHFGSRGMSTRRCYIQTARTSFVILPHVWPQSMITFQSTASRWIPSIPLCKSTLNWPLIVDRYRPWCVCVLCRFIDPSKDVRLARKYWKVSAHALHYIRKIVWNDPAPAANWPQLYFCRVEWLRDTSRDGGGDLVVDRFSYWWMDDPLSSPVSSDGAYGNPSQTRGGGGKLTIHSTVRYIQFRNAQA